MSESKTLTFTGALKCAQKDSWREISDLSKQIEKLEEAFPDSYSEIDAYNEAVGAKEWFQECIESENTMIPVLSKLDEFLEKVRERIGITPIGYGYDLVRSGDAPRYMTNIRSWNDDRTNIGSEPYMIAMQMSVFPANTLYFAFPSYSGAILYMTADINRYSETENYLSLTIGIQVIDDFDAYTEHSNRDSSVYETIPIVTFSRYYKNGFDKMNRIYNRNETLYEDLTYLNKGYCQGIYKIVCDVLKDGYMDIFDSCDEDEEETS